VSVDTIPTEVRNAELADMVAILQNQQARKLDLIVPATAMGARDGQIMVKSEPIISMDGVTTTDGMFRPTETFERGIAAKLDIPSGFLRRLRENGRTDLWDRNVNGLLHGLTRNGDDGPEVVHAADTRKFLLRLFSDGNGGGIARAMLSDRYGIMENLDGLMAMLSGIREAGVDVQIPFCQLSDTQMRVRVVAPAVRALAPTLLAGYTSPFARGVDRAGNSTGLDALRDGLDGRDPIVFAGFDLRNSEVGFGQYSIVPVITVLACSNGMTFTQEAMNRRHVGARMDEGIAWSTDTVQAHQDLTAKMTRDAVTRFLSEAWLGEHVAKIEAQAGTPIAQPAATVERVSSELKYDAATQAGILEHFILGSQLTAGGLVNAITSFAQTIPSPDKAMEVEDRALDALALVAR
jgi:hypothetical protein